MGVQEGGGGVAACEHSRAFIAELFIMLSGRNAYLRWRGNHSQDIGFQIVISRNLHANEANMFRFYNSFMLICIVLVIKTK